MQDDDMFIKYNVELNIKKIVVFSFFNNNTCFNVIGMAGLAVTYGLNLNARLSRWILSFCKLENKIISVERIHQYCQIPSEAPPIIDNCCPPSSWPETGKIEVIDLKVLIYFWWFFHY